jgi:hypothetical protein
MRGGYHGERVEEAGVDGLCGQQMPSLIVFLEAVHVTMVNEVTEES